MLRRLFLALCLTVPSHAALGQDFGCPTNVHQVIHDLTTQVAARKVSPAEAGQTATEIVRGCGRERAILAQFLEMFTVAGLAIEPPDAERFRAHVNAVRTINGITQIGAGPFAPIRLTGHDGASFEWGEIDERNAYWDLMFAVSSDFLVYGVHADFYTPGKTEKIGCGLYPDEEASALARQAEGNVDGGELVPRVVFLGSKCDAGDGGVAGHAAKYFAAHYEARRDDPDYVGLTASDIRAGLQTFLTRHLDGAAESQLFAADAVAELLNF